MSLYHIIIYSFLEVGVGVIDMVHTTQYTIYIDAYHLKELMQCQNMTECILWYEVRFT